jgi:indole-3-glycerol phosphate synthase
MILDDIILNKRQEVTALKLQFSGQTLRDLIKALPKPRNFLKAFSQGKLSLIAEIKRASPSAGIIREKFDPVSLAKVYEESGAAAISVLTDEKFFQGKLEDLKAAKESTTIPILRKDFIIDESQIYQARLAGADAVLLIARVLEEGTLVSLLELTENLGMQALVEVHNAAEVEGVLRTEAKIVGINNRDLDNFQTDLQNSINLVNKYPALAKRIIISESGINNHQDVERLRQAGFDGILVGETILRSKNIPAKISELIA